MKLKLPEKLYVPLNEIAMKWKCSMEDLLHFAGNKELKISVRLKEKGELWRIIDEERETVCEEASVIGLVNICPDDILSGSVHKDGIYRPRYLMQADTDTPRSWLSVDSPPEIKSGNPCWTCLTFNEEIEIPVTDMVILHEEVKRFETTYTAAPNSSIASQDLPSREKKRGRPASNLHRILEGFVAYERRFGVKFSSNQIMTKLGKLVGANPAIVDVYENPGRVFWLTGKNKEQETTKKGIENMLSRIRGKRPD